MHVLLWCHFSYVMPEMLWLCIYLDTMALFSILETNKGNLTDLHYFDGLANQDETIRLTIGMLRDVQTTANVIDTSTDNAEGRGSLVEDAVHSCQFCSTVGGEILHVSCMERI